MMVYSLNYKDNPQVPFYIGITNNIQRRFKEHQQNYTKHQPYITHKEDFFINTICDTGTNEYSTILAEKIETNLIKYHHTLTHGSNQVYTLPKQINYAQHIPQNPQCREKARKTRERKQHKKFKRVIKIITDDPYRYTLPEIIHMSPFVSEGALNRYTMKYHNAPFIKWLQQYQELWMDYIRNWSKQQH